MTTAPVIEELNFTDVEKNEVERILNEEAVTKRKEALRKIVKGPMCSICAALPTKRIYYDLDGVTRIEAYCDAHFLTYEKNKDTDINDIMAGLWLCSSTTR